MKTFIFLIFFMLVSVQVNAANDATNASANGEKQTFVDDNTCPRGGKYATLCCYQGYRYSCRRLFGWWLDKGWCRHGGRQGKWTKNGCNGEPRKKVTKKKKRKKNRTEKNDGSAFGWAKALTSCAGYGRRKAGRCGLCAKGVRHAIMCARKKIGRGYKYLHCGPSAFSYYGKGCLERYGFKRHSARSSACNKKGTVRVYYGHKHNNSNYRGGDRHGHIEFVGTDGRWHAACRQARPMNHPRAKGKRRILKACYTWQ